LKKGVIIIAIILIILLLFVCGIGIGINSKTKTVVQFENDTYEKYLNSEIYGTDVITLINKAISQNESNHISKDTKGYYINNNVDSVQIEVEFITDEEEQKTTTYKMEQVANLGTSEFIKNFNEAKFKCIEKRYHKETGKISYIKLLHKSS